MIALGSEKRLEMAIDRYEESEEEDFKYHFGSHYSNPGIIIMYQVRVVPYLDADIKFQSGQLDAPDRMFQSMMEQFNMSMNVLADIRELIPEMFYLPDLYIN
jgi:hypothetical protein